MFNLMYEHKFSLGTGVDDTTGDPTMSQLASGINNVEPGNNEELAQNSYLDGAGFAETDVIGAQLILAFTGHRRYGNAAQDYIFANMLNLGEDRRTPFEWTEPSGGMFAGNCTIANISGPSGDAGAKGEVSFEMHFNGKPTYTPPVVV